MMSEWHGGAEQRSGCFNTSPTTSEPRVNAEATALGLISNFPFPRGRGRDGGMGVTDRPLTSMTVQRSNAKRREATTDRPLTKMRGIDGATGPRKKLGDIFSRLDTMHQRDGQTDGRTDTPGDSKDRAYA